jgi:hypothetical protein
MTNTEFVHEGITWIVRKNGNDPAEYKDKAHVGGPWSNATNTILNHSIKLSFRKALKRAIEHMV